MYFLNASRTHTRRCLLFLLFRFFCALSSHFHWKTTRANVIVTLLYGWIIPALLTYPDNWDKVFTFVAVFPEGLKITYGKCRRFKWLTVKDVCLFFQTWWIFSWKNFALNNRFGKKTSLLPNSLNFSILARHPMPACCWHIDLGMFTYISLQPTVSPFAFILPLLPSFEWWHCRREFSATSWRWFT